MLGSAAPTLATEIMIMKSDTGLKTYQIEIVETMSAIIEIKAEDDSSAMTQAQEKYRNEDIELNYDDLVDTKFNIFDVK
ncbi:DpnD/PcfM family protein [Psychrobacter sp. CAM01]|uniref:DpnD/PcfM family protein n=1 Tax=Psychrobacter sp. CAM01 TaxID=3080335 RepID=UPI0029359068|nr:DpnD/PcfM family protein [Psychrobacter sp. CAM01]MDV2859484.1 DpnD/PcfM family protein [Psychrobacter sp. CAM01]